MAFKLPFNPSNAVNCQDILVIDYQVPYIHAKSTTEQRSMLLKVAHQFNDHEKEIHSWRREHLKLHYHLLDKYLKDLPSVPPSMKLVIHLPSYESISEDHHPYPQSNNGSNDHSNIIKQIGNIACGECHGFFQVCIYMPLPATAHTVDHDARSSFSSNQQHVTLDVPDDNEPPKQKICGKLLEKMKKIGLIFKELDLGKTTMGYALPALVALAINATAFPPWALHVFMVLFLFGFALIWNGLMLRDLPQRYGSVAEQVGVVIIIIGCFGLMASVMPALLWAPLLIGIFLPIPYFLH